jgi:hydroxyethylthiazole kinase-like uncharacterized protein yjeF
VLRAWTVEDVRAAEAVRLAQVPDGVLMQRAAAGLAAVCAQVLRDVAGGVSGRRVALLVGAGNNGGDALWAGERLARRGVRVDAVLCAPSVHAEGLAALRRAGGRVLDVGATAGADAAARVLGAAHVVVDGLVGLGGSPGLRAPAGGLVAGLRPSADGGPVVVAVDLPSGVAPDSGETPAPHVRADVTVTFGAAKPCLLLPPASRAAGRVVEVDLGLGPLLPARAAVERLAAADAAGLWPVPGADTDKYRRGVVGVVAGSAAYTGAAVLAVAGALRAGAGMVRYCGPEHAAEHVRLHHPEAVVGEGRVQAWVVGPGVDPDAGDGQRAAAESAVRSGLPCVVDAGGLAVVPALVAAGAVGPHVVLTPHAGELARLLGTLEGEEPPRDDVESRPAAHVVRAARLTGATVLLKGSTTLVAAPDGRLRSQADAPGWLATAGAGDVLAGIAGTLLAAGLAPFDAAPLAALVHGRAAARASAGGPLTAGAVAEAVPATVAALLAG